nr:MAG TPA: hypothetical protein [Caudoviricetes sp.]
MATILITRSIHLESILEQGLKYILRRREMD